MEWKIIQIAEKPIAKKTALGRHCFVVYGEQTLSKPQCIERFTRFKIGNNDTKGWECPEKHKIAWMYYSINILLKWKKCLQFKKC